MRVCPLRRTALPFILTAVVSYHSVVVVSAHWPYACPALQSAQAVADTFNSTVAPLIGASTCALKNQRLRLFRGPPEGFVHGRYTGHGFFWALTASGCSQRG